MEVKFTTTETSKDTCSGEPPDVIGGANRDCLSTTTGQETSPEPDRVSAENRGAANQISKRHCKELIRKYHRSIIVLLETHVRFDRVAVFWKRQGFTAVHVVISS
ncbi:hypothetical protein D5086_031896 [Populus alba]|uniref:Uncharacterized protein n=1 Tax=Populus alba TaxID=43335 RepID=A0ACC4AKL2_POPAL